ncbi:MAG TPA: hypothetical protein DCM87_16625 [Planctomycetes bacterium]|nr:hypothetical protein [Planctomycetota bacterium]
MATTGRHRGRALLLAVAAALLPGCLKDSDGPDPGTASYLWHAFYGSSLSDRACDIAIDADDNAYIAGRSQNMWTGPAGEFPLNPHSDPGITPDLFVLKLARDGSYLWHTFYGAAAASDQALSVAVDGAGRIHVTGFSSDTWEGPAGQQPLHAFAGGGKDLFVLKLTPEGEFHWHTFYGAATYEDEGRGLALDAYGNIYVALKSYGTWNGPGPTAPLHAYTGPSDGDTNSNLGILKLSNAGAYQWHTFLGAASVRIEPAAIAVGGGAVYSTGSSSGSWNGSAGQAPRNAHAGGENDAFVLALDGDGAYAWHTFHGSASNDGANGIAVDRGWVFVTGFSNGAWNGPLAEAPRHAYAGGADLFVFALNDAGEYCWHTFHGSAAADDFGFDLAFDADSGPYVAGRSHASWQGERDDKPVDPIDGYTGAADVVVMKLEGGGTYCWHAFYGSSHDDWGQGIALDSGGRLHVAGDSTASWTGPAGETPLHAYTGDMDMIDVVVRTID